jgi:glycosyltransferase involved in cell wall biosynthesis
MPVYNGESYIRKAIESILSQTFKDFELIIVNDGSTDNTVAIIEQFNDPRIKLVHNEQKSGLAYVRNKAINESAGKYIAILDSDDIAYPYRLQKQVDFLEENTAYCLVCGWADIIDTGGNITGGGGFSYSDNEIAPALFFHNCIAQSSVMLRKNMLPSKNPYDQDFPPAEDYHLWIRLARNHPMHIIKQPLIQYRIHLANSSSQSQQQTDKVVANILRLQFDDLELFKLTEEHQQLQLMLVYNCFNEPRELVPVLLKMYNQIAIANRQHKRFKVAEFESMIRQYMYKPLCSFFVRKQYGKQELNDLFGKSLNAAFFLPNVDICKILVKCIIGYRPHKIS